MSVKANNRNEQIIDVDAADKKLVFVIDRDKYNAFVNALSTPGKKNMAQTYHNFLMKVVEEESKKDLLDILDNNPGSEIELATAVIQEYTPDLAIIAKKRMN